MARLKFRMAGLSGLIKDMEPDQLPPDAVNDSDNFTSDVDGWKRSGGYTETGFAPSNEKTGLFFWAVNKNDLRWIVAGAETLLLLSEGDEQNITRLSSGYAPGGKYNWTFTNFNGIIVANNGVNRLQYYNERSKRMADVPQLHPIPNVNMNLGLYAHMGATCELVAGDLEPPEVTQDGREDPGSKTPVSDKDVTSTFKPKFGVWADARRTTGDKQVMPDAGTPSDLIPKNTWDPEPDEVRLAVIRSFGYFLIGIGVDEGSDYDMDKIYWSSSADPGELPRDWDIAKIGGESGQNTLPSPGICQDGLSLRDDFIVYKTDSTWIMRYIGGQYVFSTNALFDTQGILATGCVVQVGNEHFVVTTNDIILHDGIRYRSIANGKVRKWFFDNLHKTYYERTFVAKRDDANEIYIFFPSTALSDSVNPDGALCDKALVYNWAYDNWEFRNLPTPIVTAAYGQNLPHIVRPWDDQIGPWEQSGTWESNQNTKVFSNTLYVSMPVHSELYKLDDTGLYKDQVLPAFWERLDIPLGRVSRDGVIQQDYEHYKTVSTIQFDIDANEEFEVTIGTRDRLNEPVIWDEPITFSPTDRRDLNLILTAGFFSIRIDTTEANFVIRNIHVEFELGGQIV